MSIMIEMTVSELVVDTQSNTPVVVLREKGGNRMLPIWIGIMEATAIAMELEEVRFPRPMTHDLMKNLLDHLNVRVSRVEVCDLRDNTYYALIHLRTGEWESAVDARPSDAIALALRTKSPIYVADKVLKKSIQSDEAIKTVLVDPEDREKLAELLEELSPEDFGKYKM
ncbi:MAG: bifunctional nuclease family protein [Syntrophobacterales bacterium]|nr:bifunctional nuclease family protein [Syntrophobacterales bacterium]